MYNTTYALDYEILYLSENVLGKHLFTTLYKYKLKSICCKHQ